MIRRLLKLLGYRIIYRCEWGTYSHRYSEIDSHMCRPIHPQMSVAPPWATRHIVKFDGPRGQSASEKPRFEAVTPNPPEVS
jgi:hypothetical protein